METTKRLNLVLFGATGQTGKHILQMALDGGHQVTVIVRDETKLQIQNHPRLTVVKGDSMSIDSYKDYIDGKDAVISAVGSGNSKPTTLFSQGIQNLITAMKTKDCKRLICISASGIDINPGIAPIAKFLIKNILQRWLKHPYADYHLMEKNLKQCDLLWTSVRQPMLINKPFTGKYRYAANEWLPNCNRIRRADLAHFILQIINEQSTYKSIVEVAN